MLTGTLVLKSSSCREQHGSHCQHSHCLLRNRHQYANRQAGHMACRKGKCVFLTHKSHEQKHKRPKADEAAPSLQVFIAFEGIPNCSGLPGLGKSRRADTQKLLATSESLQGATWRQKIYDEKAGCIICACCESNAMMFSWLKPRNSCGGQTRTAREQGTPEAGPQYFWSITDL